MERQYISSALFLVLAVSSSTAVKQTTFSEHVGDAADRLLSVDDSTLDDIKASITRHLQTTAGQRAIISDSFIDTSLLTSTEGVLQLSGWWSFEQASANGLDKAAGEDGIPWGSEVDGAEFLGFPLGQQLQIMAHYLAGDFRKRLDEKKRVGRDSETSENDDRSASAITPFLPYQVRWKVVRRGDLTRLHRASASQSGEIWMALFFNHRWQNNHYGDLFLYDNDDEILGGANPLLGRLIAWNATLGYMIRPPCIDFSQGENVLMIRWTRDLSKAERFDRSRVKEAKEIEQGIAGGFALSGKAAKSAKTLDIGQHEVLHRTAPNGKSVYAFDGLFEEEDLQALRRYIVRHGIVFYDDAEDYGNSDNVQWISGFEVSSFVQSKFWRIIKQVAMYVSKGNGDWYPYDVSCNIIRSYDHTRLHGDVRNDKDDEWTFLLYLSDMQPGDYGETAYFEKNADDTELIYQVRAEYGRSVIFEGLIPHAARPPSPNFVGPRYSFAVKMAKTPFRATSHILYEKFSQGSSLLYFAREEEPPDAQDYVDKVERVAKGDVSKLNATLNQLIDQVKQNKEKVRQAELSQVLSQVSD